MKFQILKKTELVDVRDFQDGTYKIGRAEESDIQLDSPQVSKNHALLIIKDNRAAIVDNGSSNGVFVNGILVKKQRVREGDEIAIVDFRIKIGDAKAAQQAKLSSAPQENIQNVPQPSPRSPQEKILLLVDQRILSPLYLLMQKYDWRLILASVLMGSLVFSVLFAVIPIVRWGKNITTRESLNRAHTILTQTVRENYRILAKTVDSTRLTTEACEAESGILSCVVIDPKSNAILAPTKLFNKPISDVYSLLTLKRITDAKEEYPSVDVGDGTYMVAQPIYLYSAETKDRALSGIVLAQFQVPVGALSTFEPLVEAALFAILLSLAAYFLIFKMVSYPIIHLQEQLDAALKGENITISSPTKFLELETLARVINFTLNKMKGVSDNAPVSNDTSEMEDSQFLNAMQETDEGTSDALLVLDKDKRVRFVGKILEELIGMRNQYAQGQNISDASKDSSFAGTAIDLADNVVSSLGQSQRATLDINGVNREMNAIAHRNSAGDIRFVLLMVKMNG